jgi:hypothetical protein
VSSKDFDLSAVVDPVVQAIRLRLPEIVAAEVRRQLAAPPVHTPKLTAAELRERNALRARAGQPLLPVTGVSARTRVSEQQRDARARLAALQSHKP